MFDRSSLQKCTHPSTTVFTTNNKCILRSMQGTVVEPKAEAKISGPKNIAGKQPDMKSVPAAAVIDDDSSSKISSRNRGHSKNGTMLKLRNIDPSNEFDDGAAPALLPMKDGSRRAISESEEEVKDKKVNLKSSKSGDDAKDTRADVKKLGQSDG